MPEFIFNKDKLIILEIIFNDNFTLFIVKDGVDDTFVDLTERPIC